MQQINNNTYQSTDLGDVKPVVTIGGDNTRKFIPNVNNSFHDDEFFFNLNCVDDIVSDESATKLDGVISQTINNEKHEYYIDDSGRLKWDKVFSACPDSMRVRFRVRKSAGVHFYYQAELTAEEIADGCIRPDDIAGSYAVYCDKANNKYKTGKLCHIPRPFVIDATGNREWCVVTYEEISDTEGMLYIDMPEDFMRNADYSLGDVRLDPTFGYTTKGGTSIAGDVAAFFTRFTMPNDGDITSITAYSKVSASSNFKYALYSDKDDSEVITALRGTEEASETSFDDWKELALTSSYSGEMSTVYSLGIMSSNANCVFYYDSSDVNQEGIDYSGKTYAQMWVNCSCAFGGALKFSVYATYTESGGATGNSYYYQQDTAIPLINGFQPINLTGQVLMPPVQDRIVTVGPTERDYTSIALAIAGEPDFGPYDLDIIFEIDAGVYSSPITLDTGFTTSSSHRVIFRNASGSFHNYTRGEGVRVVGAQDWGGLFVSELSYVTIQGIACHNTGEGNCTNFVFANNTGCQWINCFSYDVNIHGYYSANSTSIHVNCVAVNCGYGFRATIESNRFYNCVALNCSSYGFAEESDGPAYFINCYSGGSGTADYYKPNGSATVTTSFSEDGSLSTSTISIANCSFTNSTAGSEDVSIGSDSDLIDVGTDLSGDSTYPFDTDGYGNSRGEDWDVGVMEYVPPSSITETNVIVDSQNSYIQTASSILETETITEAQNSIIIGLTNILETVTVISVETSSSIIPVSTIESSSIIDTSSNINIASVSSTESNTITDSQENTYITTASRTESTNIYDIEDVNGSNVAIIIENSIITEDTNSSVTTQVSTLEQIAITSDDINSFAIISSTLEETSSIQDEISVYEEVITVSVSENSSSLDLNYSITQTSVEVFENTLLSDNNTAYSYINSTLEESCTATDSTNGALITNSNVSDSSIITDNISSSIRVISSIAENSLSYDEITAVQNIQIDVIDYIQVIDNINATILHSINIEENSTTNDSSQSVILNVLTILFWNDLQLDFNNFPSSTDLKLNVRGKIVGIPIIAATDDRNGAIRIIIDSEVRALQQIII